MLGSLGVRRKVFEQEAQRRAWRRGAASRTATQALDVVATEALTASRSVNLAAHATPLTIAAVVAAPDQQGLPTGPLGLPPLRPVRLHPL